MAIAAAFHAGGSRFNWKIEGQWPQPRRKLASIELGKHSVANPDNPLAGFEDPEKAFRHISTSAMHQMHDILSGCETGGKPWRVSAPADLEFIPDWEDLIAFDKCSAEAMQHPRYSKIRAERADFSAHCLKLASLYILKMCTGPNPCQKCSEVIAERQKDDPTWHPCNVLQLLQWNDYWLPIAELKNPDLYPPMPMATEKDESQSNHDTIPSGSSSSHETVGLQWVGQLYIIFILKIHRYIKLILLI